MVRFRRCRRSVLGFIAASGFSIGCPTPEAMAAMDIALISGGFRRSIPVKQVEHLAETGEAIGLLEDLLEISGQKPEEVSKLLNQKLELPVVLTSRLINTRIGDAIVRRVAKIIYPIYAPSPEVSVPAIRTGVINGLQENGSLTAIGFLKSYPNQVMAVNLPTLFAVVEKAQSIAGLVQFFSDSPLDGLKDGNH